MLIQLSSLSNILKTLTLSREDDSRKVVEASYRCQGKLFVGSRQFYDHVKINFFKQVFMLIS